MTVEAIPNATVRRTLTAQGRKSVWLAARLGVSPGHLTRMLAGHRPISNEQAQIIADALGLPMEVIFEERREE